MDMNARIQRNILKKDFEKVTKKKINEYLNCKNSLQARETLINIIHKGYAYSQELQQSSICWGCKQCGTKRCSWSNECIERSDWTQDSIIKKDVVDRSYKDGRIETLTVVRRCPAFGMRYLTLDRVEMTPVLYIFYTSFLPNAFNYDNFRHCTPKTREYYISTMNRILSLFDLSTLTEIN